MKISVCMGGRPWGGDAVKRYLTPRTDRSREFPGVLRASVRRDRGRGGASGGRESLPYGSSVKHGGVYRTEWAFRLPRAIAPIAEYTRSGRKPQWRKWQTRAIANRLAYTDQVRAENSCACSASRPGSSPGWGTITATGWSFQPTASLRTGQQKNVRCRHIRSFRYRSCPPARRNADFVTGSECGLAPGGRCRRLRPPIAKNTNPFPACGIAPDPQQSETR